ncbi:tetratricopeptide repeat protein [Fibrella aquatica]|jgi:tetratricopeptide (TPR) repeat protein|uniref:tetratricopeptide repeat protein n=1 Tax=Fibrella aquatica TaxID=3242487 RepID=UPI00352148CC
MNKQEPLPLQRISVFMPQRLSDDEVERLFIMRAELFQTIIDSIQSEGLDGIPQHHLLIGQRGMGKTTLLKRVDVELKKQPLQRTFIPLSFPEEQYNIDRLSKFWLNSLDAIADTLQAEGDEQKAFALDADIAALAAIKNEQELSQQAYDTFKRVTQALNRRPVLLLDNLNLIFDRLGETAQSKLRKLISEPGAPIIISASPETFDENMGYDAPFYDAFAVHYLEKLSFRQMLTMLRHLSELTGQIKLLSQLTPENRSRLETLHALTGGNIRTVVILFSLIAQGLSSDVFQDLEALIDQMTPLYKSRFEELAAQAQVVVDAVALNWHPCNLETLRERTSLENNQLSVQLDRLSKSGWISRLGKRKAVRYEINERFFNVWYLMRRAVRRQRQEMVWLTRFMQVFFTRPELTQHARDFMRSVYDRENEHELGYGLALSRALPNQTGAKLKARIYHHLLRKVEGDLTKLEDMAGVNIDEVDETMVETYKVEESVRLVEEADDIYSDYEVKKKFPEAEKLCRKAIELNPKSDDAWEKLGGILSELDRKLEADECYEKAIELNSQNEWAWAGRVFIYLDSNLEKAIDIVETALRSNPKSSSIWELYTDWIYEKLTKEQRLSVCERAYIALPEKTIFATNFADALAKVGRAEEADEMYWKAIKASNFHSSEVIRYRHFLIKQRRYKDIEPLFVASIKQNEKDDSLYDYYADFLTSQERYQEAERMYKKAISIGRKNKSSWNVSSSLHSLGQLYDQDMHRYSLAEKAYRDSIDADSRFVSYYTQKDLIFLLGNRLDRIEEAKAVWQSIDDESSYKSEKQFLRVLLSVWDGDKPAFQQLLREALAEKGDKQLEHMEADDWQQTMAIAVRAGYGEMVLTIFRETGHQLMWRPFYEAIKALTLNSQDYLKTEVAAEVRDIALKIFTAMWEYNNPAMPPE